MSPGRAVPRPRDFTFPDPVGLDRRDIRDRLAALEAAMDGVVIFDEEMKIRYANPAFRAAFLPPLEPSFPPAGYSRDWTSIFHPDEYHRMNDEVLPLVSRSGGWTGRVQAVRGDGTPITVHISFSRIEDGGVVAVLRDVTVEAMVQSALEEREELLSLITHNSNDMISLHDREGRIIYVSASSLRLMGCERPSLLGRTPWDAIHPEDLDAARDAFNSALEGGTARVGYRLQVKSGAWVWFETLVRPVTEEEGERTGQVQCATRDISERKKLEEQLAHQALHDPLTGLPNRSLFMDRLAQAPLRAQRSKDAFAVLYLDLNLFKQVNDTLGHAAGDELLVQVAGRLAEEVREIDTLARLSGDEFAMILEGIQDRESLEQLTQRTLDRFDVPFDLAGARVVVRPSIGVAFAPSDEVDVEPEELLRSADLAMYAAKRDLDREWHLRKGTGNGKSEALAAALREAMESDALEIHYQPVVDLKAERVVAVEALLRWTHPEFGPVSPPEILAVAQQAQLGGALTRWILRTALHEYDGWAVRGHGGFRLSLNLSDEELASPGLAEMIENAIAEAGQSCAALQLELRARSLGRHADKLAALRAAGAIIAIDGFGVDPVSLPLLARAPIDALKMARPIVESLGDADGDGAAEAIMGMGDRLGLEVAAGGVESEHQVETLRLIGCDVAQGFHVQPPMPKDRIAEYLRDGEASAE